MHSIAFGRTFFVWSLLLAFVFAIVMWQATTISSRDQKKFHQIIASQPKKLRKSKIRSQEELTRQTRWGVTKRMWVSNESSRRVLQIAGSRSEVSVYAKDRDIGLIETFYDVEGIIQQELFYLLPDGKEVSLSEAALIKDKEFQPMQRFRYFEAQNAVYDFQTQAVVAYDVKFWTFKTEGHDVVDNPLNLPPEAVGQASSMTIFSGIADTQFSAEHLKLEIKTEQGLW